MSDLGNVVESLDGCSWELGRCADQLTRCADALERIAQLLDAPAPVGALERIARLLQRAGGAPAAAPPACGCGQPLRASTGMDHFAVDPACPQHGDAAER